MATYSYTFSGASSGSFTVTTSDTPTEITASDGTDCGQGYVITGITGTWNGAAITGLDSTYVSSNAGGTTTYYGDNAIFTGNNGYSDLVGGNGNLNGIDYQGISFYVGSLEVNVSYDNASDPEFSHSAGYYVTSGTAEPSSSLLMLDSTSYLACYAAGTRILTTRGEVAVEDLREGDLAVTESGGALPVRWIGYRTVQVARHPRPHDVAPVRVRADAFGPGRPHRDLLLSPDHAVFVDGVLIPIRYLLNGATVAQESVARVTYYHVELDHHDVLLAEGLPAESYLDTGNRGAFANGGGPVQIHPEFALHRWEAAGCAPLVRSGPRLVAVRRHLLARMKTLGWRRTGEPGLRFSLAGQPIEAQVFGEETFGAWHCLALPDGARDLAILSRQAVPGEIEPTSDDCRHLGVALCEIRLDGVSLPLDDPRLVRGWQACEPGLRWTDGAAILDVRGASLVELRFARGGLSYQLPPPVTARRRPA